MLNEAEKVFNNSEKSASTERASVVVIDDNENIRESLKFILEDEFNIYFFEDGANAVNFIYEVLPDIVITDISMPGMNGIEVLRRVKEIDETIQVIMLTGYASVESARASVRYGAFDYLVKPYDTEKLIDVIRSGVKQRRQIIADKKNIDKIKKLNAEMEREMIKSRKLAYSGQLSAGIIHEVSNPLSAIEGYLHIIEHKINNKDTISGEDLEFLKKYISITHNQLKRSIRIIRNHLDFLRVSNEDALIDLNECVEEIVTLLKYQKITLNIEIRCDYGEIPKIRANPDHFQQIFMNMLYNAIHAIENKGVIIVRTEVVKGENGNQFVSVSFIDNGKGIPKDKIEHIFEPFYTTKGKGKGTGLGMAISYEIIKKYGGDIIVKSTLGKGTKISILIPTNR